MPPSDYSPRIRARLIAAGAELLHERGFQGTTLADLAARSGVTLAKVRLHFETEEALAKAVISSHEQAILELLASWTQSHAEPQTRLRCLVRAPLDATCDSVRYGYLHGDLYKELERLEAATWLSSAGARLLDIYLDWTQAQFEASGYGALEARDLAEQLVASIQGTLLIAHTLRSEELAAMQLTRIERWLDAAVRKFD